MANCFCCLSQMPWCALLTAVKNYNRSLENLQDFFFKTETKTKTKCSRPRPRLHDPRSGPILSFFVLEAPRDQDSGLEDYITGILTRKSWILNLCSRLTRRISVFLAVRWWRWWWWRWWWLSKANIVLVQNINGTFPYAHVYCKWLENYQMSDKWYTVIGSCKWSSGTPRQRCADTVF